ncbi:ATP-binding protein [Paenibacillus sp. A14]|uniref:ATP-binding protein n=1 Tax=Paenibacillus sp. A14 TaxID=3119820 RepID=UPI002FE262D6
MPLFGSKYHIRMTLAVLAFLCLAVYIHAESIRYPYIGALLERSGPQWIVAEVNPYGKAAVWGMGPGDRVLTIDGEAADERLGASASPVSLVKVSGISFAGMDGTVSDKKVSTDIRDALKNLFSVLAELVLLAIGLSAYRKNPNSRLVRQFAAINFVMALVILTLYSTEMRLSDFILSLSAIWLPYMLLSFCVSFVIRSVSGRLRNLLRAFCLFCVLFSGYVVYAVAGEQIPGWIREAAHVVFMVALLLVVLAVGLYWKQVDRIEKNQALVLVTGMYFSLLPYVFLYILPDLIRGDAMVPPEYALTGLVPLSATMLYVLNKRSLVDMKLYLPRVMIHSLYFGAVFILFLLGPRLPQPFWPALLFLAFLGVTLAYRKSLRWSERSAGKRKEWLDRQTLKLSIQTAEARNIRDILNMIGEVMERVMDVTGICLVWRDGSRLIVHGTGAYASLPPEEGEWLNHGYLQSRFDFIHIEPLIMEGESEFEGFLCVGPKRNSSLMAADEKELIISMRNEAIRLLINARRLAGLQQEYQRTKEQNAVFERRVSDMRLEQRMLMEAQHAERIRTTYFLHDHLLQNLIFLSRDLEELADRGKVDRRRVEIWLKCVYDSQRDIRLLCDDLHPAIAEKAGLEEALKWLVRSAEERGIDAVLSYDWGLAEPPDRLLRSNLFRMIRELTNNALKHAEATHLELRVRSHPEEGITCVVSDNGRGFDPVSLYRDSRFLEGKHIGLISVSAQVEYLGGEMELQASPGKGTRVTLKLAAYERKEGDYGKLG